MTDALPRVRTTEAARVLIEALRARHGAILFYQSHGCCAGSAPMCFTERELALGPGDRLLGRLDGAPDGVPVYASEAQCDYLAGLAMTLDVAPGDSGSFGLEDGSGRHFVAHFRLWTDEEVGRLAPIAPALPARAAP